MLRDPGKYLTPDNYGDHVTIHMVGMVSLVSRSAALTIALSSVCDPRQATFSLVSSTSMNELSSWKAAYDLSARNLQLSATIDHRKGLAAARARVNLAYHCPIEIGTFFTHCHSAATAMIRSAKVDYGAEGIRSAPDAVLVFIMWAGLSLLTYCRPRVAKHHSISESIMSTVDTLVDLFERAGNEHPQSLPHQYGKLLRHIMRVQEHGGMRTTYPSREPSRAGTPVPQATGADTSTFVVGEGDFTFDTTFFPHENFNLPMSLDGLFDDMGSPSKVS
ncbi:hypothetical protein RQP46_011236 [Phenoliferia psychrophenolica]